MLLSSVNFVAKAKCGKAAKSKDEKSNGLKSLKVTPKTDTVSEPVDCPQCRLEAKEENTIFKFPSTSYSSKSSGYDSLDSAQSNPGDRVTVATGDDFCLSVDQFFYTMKLRDGSKSDSTCIFRKRVLDTERKSNGHIETVVLALDCDQDFYLTTTKDKSLELNYFTEKPSAENPDERVFLVYYTSIEGQLLIQPKLHKNVYLHHIDNVLSVQQLDLNWRCPEEYFFHFNAQPEVTQLIPTEKLCSHISKTTEIEQMDKNIRSKVNKWLNEEVKENMNIELPTRKSKSKFSITGLFLGCVSGRSHRLTQTEV